MLTSCSTPYHSYPDRWKERMTSLRFSPREGDLDVYFKGVSKPNQDYLQIGVVKMQLTTYSTREGELLENLKQQALGLGANALIVMEKGNSVNVYNDFYGNIRTAPRENMWGIAIRYLDNISYEKTMLTHLTVTPLAQDISSEGGDIVLDRKLELVRELPNSLTKYVYLHSLEFLLHSTEGWNFRVNKRAKDENFYHLERQYIGPYGTKTELKTKVVNDDMPSEIHIKMLAGRAVAETMRLITDEKDRIIRREWTERNLDEVVVTRKYNDDDTCEEELYTIKKKDSPELVQYLIVNYNYMSADEFREVLNNEQIIRVNEK